MLILHSSDLLARLPVIHGAVQRCHVAISGCASSERRRTSILSPGRACLKAGWTSDWSSASWSIVISKSTEHVVKVSKHMQARRERGETGGDALR